MMIIRYGKPNKLDKLPYGTTCKLASTFKDEFEVYVQINNDENYPNWYLIGAFNSSTESEIPDATQKILDECKKHMEPTKPTDEFPSQASPESQST
jgi:hypothetical protein